MIELNKTEQMLPKHENYNTDLLNICIYNIQSLVLVSIVYAQINPYDCIGYLLLSATSIS